MHAILRDRVVVLGELKLGGWKPKSLGNVLVPPFFPLEFYEILLSRLCSKSDSTASS